MATERKQGRLVLSRKSGERVRVTTPAGEVIWVEVGDRHGEQVALRFIADLATVITREEHLPEGERYQE
jgi:sRNA-binding carbon storage regulator CsrA